MSIEADVRYLKDRLEIQDVVTRYGLGQDLHQGEGDNNVLEQWSSVFAPDATVDYSAAGTPAGISFPALAETMRGKGLDGTGTMSALRRWQHFEGVATVRIEGDIAYAITPHLHTHTDKNGRWNLMEAGMFHDRLERRPEGWRIVHRRLEIHWLDTFESIAPPELADLVDNAPATRDR
jgi:hypothetical protein